MPTSRAPKTRATRVKVRRALPEDIPALFECQAAAYKDYGEGGLCTPRQLGMQIEVFPEGQLVAVRGEEIVGYAMSLIVTLDEESPWHSYAEITGDGTFGTHDPAGDSLYGADIGVHPDYQGRGVAAKLYKGRMNILRRFNLRRMIAGGRIPGYRSYAGRMSAETYVEKVCNGELKDPALSAHLKAGYKVLGIHMGYLRDAQSLDYATHIEFKNTSYRESSRRIAASPMKRPVRKIRVCAAQYQMRRVSSWEEFEHQVDFFVETAAEYHSHFLLFPELFTVQLFSMLPPSMSPVDAISELADMTERYIAMFVEKAKRTGIYIIGGSHPVRVGDEIRNVAHLFTPSGGVHTQDKLHVTPNEREEYGIMPGEGLKVFETSHARIAINICYDVEFPELARLQALAGAEVLFVPFSTDERRAYLRVRYTGQARAVENVMYTVLAGNVGNLPQVENFLINYGQAAICTPSDFAFPTDGIAGTAEPNNETVVISDLDLVVLEETREMGSVRPWRDRRPDMYEITAKTPVEVIRVS